jgi:hypothetical protein
MTLGALEIKKVRKYLNNSGKGMKTLHLASTREAGPLSGKALVLRLKGLMTKKEANLLDRHINESCEQIDD